MTSTTQLDELKTMVRTHTALLLQALDALESAVTAPTQPPLQWDERLTQRGVRYMPAAHSPWRLLRGTYREGAEAQGRHHILIETFDAQVGRVVDVPIVFAWAEGTDTRVTEPKPGEAYALSWPLFAAGGGYAFTVDGGPRVEGMGLGTIEHPERGDHVSYEFVFVRDAQA